MGTPWGRMTALTGFDFDEGETEGEVVPRRVEAHGLASKYVADSACCGFVVVRGGLGAGVEIWRFPLWRSNVGDAALFVAGGEFGQ